MDGFFGGKSQSNMDDMWVISGRYDMGTIGKSIGKQQENHRKMILNHMKPAMDSRLNMGLSLKMVVPPIAGWFTRENPNLNWMMTRGTSILGNFHMKH